LRAWRSALACRLRILTGGEALCIAPSPARSSESPELPVGGRVPSWRSQVLCRDWRTERESSQLITARDFNTQSKYRRVLASQIDARRIDASAGQTRSERRDAAQSAYGALAGSSVSARARCAAQECLRRHRFEVQPNGRFRLPLQFSTNPEDGGFQRTSASPLRICKVRVWVARLAAASVGSGWAAAALRAVLANGRCRSASISIRASNAASDR